MKTHTSMSQLQRFLPAPIMVLALLMLMRPPTASAVSATGGSMTTNGGYVIHTYTNTGATSLVVTADGEFDVLVVAGGGGGGNAIAGGGGAGGMIYTTAYGLVAGTVPVFVGQGGSGSPGRWLNSFDGTNSSLGALVAYGGGGGGTYDARRYGNGGGSGGGNGHWDYPAGPAAATNGQGNIGGVTTNNGGKGGGGGGGAGTAGTNGLSTLAGKGGEGRLCDISGTPTNYAGGGGGGARSGTPRGDGGIGGGGNGSATGVGSAGTRNTGGGGAYVGTSYYNGGNGGSGIVIVRYPYGVSVQALPSGDVGSTNVVVNGRLVFDRGGGPTEILFCWGYTNSGTGSTSDWPNVFSVGNSWTDGQEFSHTIDTILGSSYVYRVYATNSVGEDWSGLQGFACGRTVVISGSPVERGNPSPNGYGVNMGFLTGTMVTNSVTSPFSNEGDLVLRQKWTCLGWNLSNGFEQVDAQSGTQAEFAVTTNMFLKWYWTNNMVELSALASSTNGSVSSSGWYTNGTVVEITASPSNGCAFLRWWGDVPGGSESNNPLSVTMDQPRTVIAQWKGETRRWNGIDATNWYTAINNWNPIGPPSPEDDVIIESGIAVLDSSCTIRSLTMTNAVLSFQNWSTTLTASNVVLHQASSIRLGAYGSNRVNLACSNLTIDVGGHIYVTGAGYSGGYAGRGEGQGYGDKYGDNIYATTYGGGGGYGGRGGAGNHWAAYGGAIYGSADPAGAGLPGSGGGGSFRVGIGGSGGGAARVEVAGKILLNGTMTANGGDSGGEGTRGGGGGSGGGIAVICSCIDSNSAGSIQAAGGHGGVVIPYNGGGGGGGRIAIQYDPQAQALEGRPKITISVRPGGNTFVGGVPQPGFGTIWLTDGQLLSPDILTDATGFVYGVTNWMPESVNLTNRAWILCEPSVRMRVNGNMALGSQARLTLPIQDDRLDCGGDLTIADGCRLTITGANSSCDALVSVTGSVTIGVDSRLTCTPDMQMLMNGNLSIGSNAIVTLPIRNRRLDCGGDLTITDGGLLTLYGGPTNESTADYGALVSVTGNVTVGAGSWIYPHSDTTNGGSVLFVMQNLTLSGGADGGFDASGRGFAGGYGPGTGTVDDIYGGGGGYGGMGGTAATNTATGGPVYGLDVAPYHPGSGSGHTNGGSGGGYIRIEAKGTVVAGGVLRANGAAGILDGNGAGSGGGIFVRASEFSGDGTGILEARGGDGNTLGGGGGGGRIAVWYGVPEYMKAGVLDGTVAISITDYYPNYGGSMSVANGTGCVNPPDDGAAQPGSLIFLTVTEGALIEIR